MAAFDPATLDRWRALAIVDRDGTTVGTIQEFYLDRETGQPTWALVNTGLFGASQTFVPLVHATEIDDGLQVPYEKRHIKDAPHVDPHDELTPDEEATLFTHYGVDYHPLPTPDPGSGVGPGADPGAGGSAGVGRADPGSSEAPGPVLAEPGSVDAPGSVPAEPGTADPDQVGRAENMRDETTRPAAKPGEAMGDESGGAGSPPEPPPEATDPDLSRPAPVEPGLPGSTSSAPSGSSPTTISSGAVGDPTERPAEEAPQAPGEAVWAPGSPGGFEEHRPTDRPTGSSDPVREAKLAAEQDRITRASATQPEESSPLERAKRRLERLVGGGQDVDDAEASTANRDTTERARLSPDEDDPRSR